MAEADKGADTGAQDTGAADKAAAMADTGKAADATAKPATTIIDTAGTDEKASAPADTTAAAPADWRARLAGEDAAFLKRLARFPDEAAFAKSYRAMEVKMSSGELKKALPETATAEEVATWRKENGIPENEAGYVEKLSLADGLVIGETDKPVISELAKAALENNVDPKAFNGLVSKYYAIQEAQAAAQSEADDAFKKASEDALRTEWQGPDYRRNLTAVKNMLEGFPEELRNGILLARDPSGRILGDNPAFIKQLAALALELNPLAPLVPMGTTDPVKTAQGELEDIRNIRRNDPAKYEANRKNYDARELELIEATLKLKNRAA